MARRPFLLSLAAAPLLAVFASCQHTPTDVPKPPPTPSTQSASAAGSIGKPSPSAAASAKPSPLEKLRSLKPSMACVLSNTAPVQEARKAKERFPKPEPVCEGQDFLSCDSVEHTPKGGGSCFVSNDNLRQWQQKAVAAGASAPPKARAAVQDLQKVRFFDRIDAHFALDARERERLLQNGFVVLDRIAYANYANAFHDIFQEELPLYVGPDPILHAVFRATEVALERVEKKKLAPALKQMLLKLHRTLDRSAKRWDETTRKDLDIYLAVALSLLGVQAKEGASNSLYGQDALVAQTLEAIARRQLEPVEIFGRSRMVDFSQYEPRGHYAAFSLDWSAESYFTTLTWLSRFEYNLVSRGSRSSHPDASPDPSETPREARDALALAELFQAAGALAELRQFDAVYTAFAGRREDVSIEALLALMQKGHFTAADPEAPAKLKQTIGNDYRRTTRVHFMPQGSFELPAIATVMGPRIAPDTLPLTRLVHDKLPNRSTLSAADVGYVLGQSRAGHYLGAEKKTFPALQSALDTAQAELSAQASAGTDVQSSYLRALLALSKPAEGLLPSFMERAPYLDLRLASTLVGYAQLRHTFVLLSGQGYDAYGCAIPDAYVEPLKPFYAALIDHTQKLQTLTGGGFEGLLRTLRTLSTIASTELGAGVPTKAQTEWLGMVAEHLPLGGYGGDSGEPPKWTGWYFDMFEDREIGATQSTHLVADYFTLTNADQIAYLGTDGPRLGVFLVDTGGEARALVGPVASGYELTTPISQRLNDAEARHHPDKRALFRESFAVPPMPTPDIELAGSLFDCSQGDRLEQRLVLASPHRLGPVTVRLLDHHGDPLSPPLTQVVEDGLVVYAFLFPEIPLQPSPPPGPFMRPRAGRSGSPVEALSVRIEDLTHSGKGKGFFAYITSPSVFLGKSNEDDSSETRPLGTAPFFLGFKDPIPSAPSSSRPIDAAMP